MTQYYVKNPCILVKITDSQTIYQYCVEQLRIKHTAANRVVYGLTLPALCEKNSIMT
jgi:hypothetical protein